MHAHDGVVKLRARQEEGKGPRPDDTHERKAENQASRYFHDMMG